MPSLEKGLRDFAQLAAKLKGDEKSEAQPFLFHFGWPGRCLIEMKPRRDPYRTLETPAATASATPTPLSGERD